MRLRNIPGSREIIAENPFVVPEGEPIRGHWKKRFGNENPVHRRLPFHQIHVDESLFLPLLMPFLTPLTT